jgi:Lecithin retinol acyltransferase
MIAGDLLLVRCWYHCMAYAHFGIDMGDGTVIELASDHRGDPEVVPNMETMLVRRTSLEDFSRNTDVYVVDVEDSLDTSEVLRRAESKLGENAYCLVSGNCEHFARWCKVGKWESQQVNEVQERVARTVTQVAVLLGAHLSSKVAVNAQTSLLASSRKTGMLLPSLLGEAAEYIAHATLSRTTLSPAAVQRHSQTIGYGTVAIIGTMFGGPIGSVSAVAAHAFTRAAVRLAR